MSKRFLIAVKGKTGVTELHPLKQWLRQHPDQLPAGMTAESTSHQLRGGLKKQGWGITETQDEVRISQPGIVNELPVCAEKKEDGAARGRGAPHSLTPITLEDLNETSARFQQLEKRGSFFEMATGLLQEGHEIEACVLLLATWNFASFRYAATTFDIDGLTNVLRNELSADFTALSGCDLRTFDLTEHASRIEKIFDRLACMKEVLYTGATKLMHLKCPNAFVIWDDYIRGGKPTKYYENLPCVLSQKWSLRRYDRNGKGYVSFLSDVQSRVRNIPYPEGPKTLAKAIDEFHYVNITLPIQRIEDEQRAEGKTAKGRRREALRRLGRKLSLDELEELAGAERD